MNILVPKVSKNIQKNDFQMKPHNQKQTFFSLEDS